MSIDEQDFLNNEYEVTYKKDLDILMSSTYILIH